MKSIILYGTMIFVEDMAGGIELKATGSNERDAEWVAVSLEAYHKVPLHRPLAGEFLPAVRKWADK